MLQIVQAYLIKFENNRLMIDNVVVRAVVVAATVGVGVGNSVVVSGHLYKRLISRISLFTYDKKYIKQGFNPYKLILFSKNMK